jgi:hypothetical protein
MYIPNCPEDSILRRHFEAAVEMNRQMWLQMPPSDSVLRRHAMSMSMHSSSAPKTAPVSHAATPPPKAASSGKGLIGWLRGLFA